MSEAKNTDNKKKKRVNSGPKNIVPHPKGRQAEKQAFSEIRNLLGDRPRRRDLLIEFLHLIQDRYHCLAESHLMALAHEMKLSYVEVFEVATFYAHFDVVRQGEGPPPTLTVRVCDSLVCEMNGAKRLLAELAKSAGGNVRVVRNPCMGQCDLAPVAEVGHYHVTKATAKSVHAVIDEGRTDPEIPPYKDFEAYEKEGGYRLLWNCLMGTHTPEKIISIIEEASLSGLGGAGFPAGLKWKFVRKEPGPRLMTINADEGEPGTFKDRFYLKSDPHRFFEGMLIAAWVVEASDVYIYLRDEFSCIREVILREIPKIEAAGLTVRTNIHLRRGAGSYICGEESAMIESIEGKRGIPRHRPPYVATVGLFGRPTLNHNVETVYWVRDIVEKGAGWFKNQGRDGRNGIRGYSVSGRVRKPGVKLAPMGITVRELIDEYCGGMAAGHRFKAYLPGGASGGILPASMADIPLDFGTLEEHGCFIGSAAVIVLSDKDDMRDVVLNLLRFFESENCGRCTPCKAGTEKAVKLLEQPDWDQPLLEELYRAMADASICGLGYAAGNPILSMMRYFEEDLA